MVDSLAGWDEFPLRQRSVTEDGPSYWALLEKKAYYTFTSDPANISLEFLRSSVTGTASHTIVLDFPGLEQVLRSSNTDLRNEVIFVSQTNTRSRLQMTLDMFRMLCHARSIPAKFIDIVVAFGFKSANIDEYFTTCSRHFYIEKPENSKSSQPFAYDISFNIRYVEEHGRAGLSDPWSHRQTALHQYYDLRRCQSMMVFLQCPPAAKKSLETHIKDNQRMSQISPLVVQIILFKACSRNWRWYLNYLSDTLRGIKDDVTWARIDGARTSKEDLSFDQSQDLEVLRWKLRDVCASLDSQFDLGNIILRQAKEITNSIRVHCPAMIESHERVKGDFHQCIADVRMHRRKASHLLDASRSIDALILKLLDLRNFNVSNRNATALKNIAEASSTENHLMVQIANIAGRDSRTMKITSFIAVVFLPATLVSSIFSTELLSGVSSGQGHSSTTLIWLYIVLTTLLTGATVATVFIWNRNASRSLKPQTAP